MLSFLKFVRIAFWVVLMTLLFSLGAATSVITYNKNIRWEDIATDDNISSDSTIAERETINKSRNSAVKISSMGLNFFAGSSTMTGTYFVAKERHYVLTVHHGILGPCFFIVVSHDDQTYSCKEYVTMDKINDYVIIELEGEIFNRDPIRIPQDLPRGNQWKKSYSILNKIIYTGYPNTVGPLTLRGDVVGYNKDEYLYVFSHAYGGASGSGVFSKQGKYIGYVVAIDVGSTDLGVDVLENIVIVAPALNIDWNSVLQ